MPPYMAPIGLVHWPAVRHIAIILIMKLCTNAVEMFMSRQDPESFHWVNGHCEPQNLTSEASVDQGHYVNYWKYLLPVLGGILCNTHASYISVIQLGGFVTLISTTAMAFFRSHGLLCNQSSLSHLLWLLPPLCTGLTEPCLIYGVLRWPRQPRHLTAACALLFVCTALGQQLDQLEEWAELINYTDNVYALAGILGSALCTFLAISLQEDSDLDQLEMPTVARMVRYSKILSGLTLFVALTSDVGIYESELRYFGGLDNPKFGQSFMAFIGLSGSCLVSIAAVRFVELPVQARIYAGILLKFSASVCLLAVTAASTGEHNGQSLSPVFLAAALLDGVAKGLTMVAYFEFMDTISPRTCKPLVTGIMLTVWGIGGLLSLLMSLAFKWPARGNPATCSASNCRMLFIVYHLFAMMLLLLSIVHHRFLSVPLSRTLIEDDSWNAQEQRPLCDEDSSEDANVAGA